ncbi:hypothetical protein H5410_008243 [Solanum commersonii]|uniref:DUF4283 domain-containing protein n=1 Tax=Solanum commersonii TaxID=4109 RepID=A0A9J6AF48_SOLCO|nr:hypothetical protein H5410_008243 [Solanum commersonii]
MDKGQSNRVKDYRNLTSTFQTGINWSPETTREFSTPDLVVSAAKAPMNTVPLLVNTVPLSTVDPVGRHHLKGLTGDLEPDPVGMKEANPWVSLFAGKSSCQQRDISQTWANVANPDLFYHDEGYYVVKFQSEPDLKEILFAGPYSKNNKPMILKQWTPKLDFKSEFLTEILLWVTFPKLPLNCWGCDSLSRIVSAIGIPIFVDECTTKNKDILC